MPKLLLDANISPETARFLRSLGFSVKSLIEENLAGITDEQVVTLAEKERRVIITFDLDFGRIYHFKEQGKVGIVVLRLENQTVESQTPILRNSFCMPERGR